MHGFSLVAASGEYFLVGGAQASYCSGFAMDSETPGALGSIVTTRKPRAWAHAAALKLVICNMWDLLRL